MKELLDAEVFVDTVFSVETGAGNGTLFYLSDYASMHEFQTDCASWFSAEQNPEYLYTNWWGIPDSLINRTWLCPNIFEIRDAIQRLDEDYIERFPEWCRTSGHDIATEDPLMLVTRYQDCLGSTVYEPGLETAETDDYAGAMTTYTLAGLGIGPIDIFDDNYND